MWHIQIFCPPQLRRCGSSLCTLYTDKAGRPAYIENGDSDTKFSFLENDEKQYKTKHFWHIMHIMDNTNQYEQYDERESVSNVIV